MVGRIEGAAASVVSMARGGGLVVVGFEGATPEIVTVSLYDDPVVVGLEGATPGSDTCWLPDAVPARGVWRVVLGIESQPPATTQ